MSSKPDIILIITDQQRYDTIAALGASHMETPNIDRLADRADAARAGLPGAGNRF